MRLRIFTEPQQGADYAILLKVASATEALGFDAFFRSDHYLAMGDRSGLPGPTDSWVTLGGLALQTSRIRLGTMVTAATFRLPGPLAISVAQVDQMSGGRVEFGFGTGWFEQEHTAYGIPFPSLKERFDRFEEQLAIITGLWATPPGQTFSHRGAYYQLTDSPALPKPAQQPRPAVILGGAGPGARRGWRPGSQTSTTWRSRAWPKRRRRSTGSGRPARKQGGTRPRSGSRPPRRCAAARTRQRWPAAPWPSGGHWRTFARTA